MQKTRGTQSGWVVRFVCGVSLGLGLLVSPSNNANAQVIFEDDFSIAGPGPGVGWLPAPDFPNIVNERREIAGRGVYEIASQSAVNGTYGIQQTISLNGASHIQIDLNAAVIMSAGTNAGVILQLGTDSTTYGARIVFQNWRTGVLMDGRGSGGAFASSAPDGSFNMFEYYTARIDIDASGTTLSLLSDDTSTVFYSYTNSALTINDLPSSVNIAILQTAGPGTTIADVYVNKISVVAVPEPSSAIMLLLALGGVAATQRKRTLQA